jgi:lyso-ornithine lipid O-acyltransferase
MRVLGTVATGALILAYVSLTSRAESRPAWLARVVRWWHGRLHRALGVQVRVTGSVVPGCLLVSNHISWLDVPVLGAQGPLGFLSKSEVRAWPLAGWMAATAGTLFIERGGNRMAEVTGLIAGRIAAGGSLVVFPEGTTSRGLGVRRFHPRLFAIAQQPGLGVQPVALAYRRADNPGTDPEPDLSVAFVGTQTLMANLWQLLRHPGVVAEVHCLPPMDGASVGNRRALSQVARAAILAALGMPESAGLDEPPNRVLKRNGRPDQSSNSDDIVR